MKVSKFFGPVVLFWAELSGAIRYRFSSSYRRKILESSLVVAMDSADPVYSTEYDYKSCITYEKDLTAKAAFRKPAFRRVNPLNEISRIREKLEREKQWAIRKELEMEREKYFTTSWKVDEDGTGVVIYDINGNVVRTLQITENDNEDN